MRVLFAIAGFLLWADASPGEKVDAGAPIDVILVAGQSNAVGFDAKASELPADPDDREILFWWRCGDPPPDAHDSTSGGRRWTHLQPQPVGAPKAKDTATRQYGNFSQPEGGFGPEIGLARHLNDVAPSRRLAVVKAAFSGTGIRKDWNPKDKIGESGACYRALVAEARAALGAAEASGKKMRFRAFVWVQGEGDANPGDAPHYADALAEMIAALRADLEVPDLKALVAVNTKFGEGANAYVPKIVEAQKAVAADDPNCVYVDTATAGTANKFHYDTAGTLDVGRWIAEALLEMER